MEQEIKFTEEELMEIKQLQNDLSTIIFSLGQIEVEKTSIDERIEQLHESKLRLQVMLKQNKQKESELAKSFSSKYGDGNLDISTGVFKPTKIENN